MTIKNESGIKIIDKTTKKQMFVPGGKGGPGRGHSPRKDALKEITDLLELVSVAAKEGIIEATDVSDKVRSAKLALAVLQLQQQKPDDDEPAMLSFVSDIRTI